MIRKLQTRIKIGSTSRVAKASRNL